MRRALLISLLALLALSAFIVEICVGTYPIGPAEALTILFGLDPCPIQTAHSVVWDIRLPRAIMGLLAGAVLAIAGATLQGVLRNPLVSPFTIGVSSAASFGAALAIVLGFKLFGVQTYVVTANAFVFAVLAVALALGIAKLRGMTSESVILAGIALMYLFSAGITLLQYIAREWQLVALVRWVMGDLSVADWGRVAIAAPAILVCVPLFKYAWDLNALMMGDDVAMSLGTDPGKTRLYCALLSALAVALIVCSTGPIGFICLVTPHIVRFLVGSDYRFVLMGSAAAGPLLLLVADVAAKMVMAPSELPVGVLTSMIGVPFFLSLFFKRRREIWR